MSVQPMVVQSDFWAGGGEGAQGAYFVKAGTVVDIDPADTSLVDFYGGARNLAPLPAAQTGDDADHVALQD